MNWAWRNVLTALTALAFPLVTEGVTYFHVATNGLDTNPGTLASPFKTLVKARDAVREINQGMSDDIVVYVRGGTHRLSSTLQLVENSGTHDSGFNGHTVIWKAYPGEKPVISGGSNITDWLQFDAGKNIWRTHVGTNLNTRQLYVNGVRAIRARGAENPGGFSKTTNGYTTSNTNMQHWGNKNHIEFVDGRDWHHYRCGVSSIVGTTITMTQPAWSHCQFHSTPWDWTMDAPDWIENAYELLDAPREWYLDRTSGYLYYKPGTGETMATAEVVVPMVEALMTGIGTTTSYLHDLRFEGLTFTDATWLEPSDTMGYGSWQAGYYYITNGWVGAQMYASVNMAYVRGVHFERNVFKRLGGAGLAIGGEWRTGLPKCAGSTNVAVIGNVFTDISGTGIAIGHGQTATGYYSAHEHERPRDVLVANNYVTGVGREYQDCVGIYVGHGDHVRLLHNEIHETPYSGISVGWGWGWTSSPYAGRNEIGWNHVHRTLLSRRDGGAIYTLDKQPGSTIHDNYLHDQVNDWGALYLDEGTRYYTVTNNVVANAPYWLFIWTSTIQSNTVMHNYSTTTTMRNDGLYNTIASNQTGLSTWPTEAQTIIAAAGLESSYEDIKQTPPPGTYTNGFVWDRSVDFDDAGNPNTDAAGTAVWNLRYATGGDLIASGETANNWWKQAGTSLIWDSSWWGGVGVWARADNTEPLIADYGLELGLGAAQAPLARWVNPAGTGVTLRIDGTVTKGGDNTSYAYDFILAVRDVSAGTWSYVTKTNLPGTATSVASYTNREVTLDANDEIIIGFKSSATMSGWYQLYDNLTFTLVSGGGSTTTSTTTSTSTSTTTSMTTSSTTTAATPGGGGSTYTNGFVWDRSVDFDSAANPNTDAVSNGVWHLRYATGGELIAAGETGNNWWKQAGTALNWDANWWSGGYGVWARGDNTEPLVADYGLELGLGASQAPLVRWVNPAGNGITLRIDGSVTKGGDNTSYAYDFVLAVRDVSAGTWSYVTKTNLPGAATSVASYTNRHVALDDSDELIIGFKTTSTMSGWYQLYDNLTFTIVSGGGTTTTPTSTSSSTSTSTSTTTSTSSTTTTPSLPSSGLLLWLAADDVDGDGAVEGLSEAGLSGGVVQTWRDKSSSQNHATLEFGNPQLAEGELGGRDTVRLTRDNLNLTSRISNIRTVFWVVKETRDASPASFLLGDTATYHFHRGNDYALWSASYAHANVRNGTTRVDGTVVNGTTAILADGQPGLISLITTGNVQANTIGEDRNGAYAERTWSGDIAELLIYSAALNDTDRVAVETYLRNKWLTYTNGFLWDRYADYSHGAANPMVDAAGNGVWHLRHTYGGEYTGAGETVSNWWKQAGTALEWDAQWWNESYGVWARGDNLLPCIKQEVLELGLNTGAEHGVLVRWVNPAGDDVSVSLDGVLTKGGSGYTATSYDYVMAVHDVSANSWSYVMRTNLPGTATNVDNFATEEIALDANDEIVWGIRATGNIPANHWYSLDDNVGITLTE